MGLQIRTINSIDVVYLEPTLLRGHVGTTMNEVFKGHWMGLVLLPCNHCFTVWITPPSKRLIKGVFYPDGKPES